MKLNLKPLRISAKLTQAKIANELEVEQASVSRWETGESMPGVEKLVALAELFGCTIDDLFTPNETDEPAQAG